MGYRWSVHALHWCLSMKLMWIGWSEGLERLCLWPNVTDHVPSTHIYDEIGLFENYLGLTWVTGARLPYQPVRILDMWGTGIVIT